MVEGGPKAPAPVTGRHRIEAELGRGGVGAVYRAVELATGRVVALKTLEDRSPLTIALFEREYYALASINHPCVIEVYDYSIAEDGRRYYTMELLEGNDLAALAPTPWRKACEYVRDIAASLALLHARQLLHRDVSPRNVRVGSDENAKLIDFGSVVPFGVVHDIVGTPMCIAPEHLRHAALDQRADLFSLGATAYFALTGRRPYVFKELRDAHEAYETPPIPISTFVEDVPPALEELVMSMLSVDPFSRPASAAEVINRVGAAAELEEDPLENFARAHLLGTAFAGREHERAQLKQLLQRLARGHGGVVMVEGSPGMGRTRFATEVVLEARLGGCVVLSVDALAHPEANGVMRGMVAELLAAAPSVTADALSANRTLVSELLPVGSSLATGPESEQTLPPPSDPAERRTLTQKVIVEAVAAVSAQSPVVVVVDDAHAADAASAAALFGLAQAARNNRILVVATQRTGEPAPVAIQQLSRAARRIKLRGLSEAAVDALVASAFGDAPHRARLTQWLLTTAHGNPAHSLDLLSSLVERGNIRYEGGVWALPVEIGDRDLPQDLEQTLRERIARLSASALQLARLLAVYQGGLTVNFCTKLLPGVDRTAISRGFEELVMAGIGADSGGNHRLRQEALRGIVLESLSSDERSQLHVAVGRALLSDLRLPLESVDTAALSGIEVPELVTTLQAGLHLVSGGERARGSEILRAASWELTFRGEGLAEAVPTLEAALQVYRAQNRSRYECAYLMIPLTLAGTYSDFRLNYRYGDECFESLAEATGIARAQRWSRFLGARLALGLSLFFAALFPRFTKASALSDGFRYRFLGLLTMASAIVGTCIVLLDEERGQRILHRLGPLKSLPRGNVGRLFYDFLEVHVDVTSGDYGAAMKLAADVLERLCAPGGPRDLPEKARQQLEVGIRGVVSNLLSTRTDGSVADSLKPLEALRVGGARRVVAGTRAAYHVYRGERVEFERWQREVDLLSAQSGSTWRQDVVMVRSTWWLFALSEDVVGLKRSVRQLETFAEDAPALRDMRDVARACYLTERGCSAEALERFSEVLERCSKRSNSHGMRYAGVYARILREVGRAEDALRVCSDAINGMLPIEAGFTTSTIGVELERGLALAELGQLDAAAAEIDRLIHRESVHDNPIIRGLTHKARAEIALRQKDSVAFGQQLEAMRGHFKRSENPALVAQGRRLLEASRRQAASGELGLGLQSADVKSLRSGFASCRTTAERCQLALDLIVERAGADHGYLFLLEQGTLALAAPMLGIEPPEKLHQELSGIIEKFQREEVTETVQGAPTELKTQMETDDVSTREIGDRTFRSILLWTSRAGEISVVGAVALVVGDERLAPIEHAFLEEVARNVSMSGEPSLVSAETSGRAFESGNLNTA